VSRPQIKTNVGGRHKRLVRGKPRRRTIHDYDYILVRRGRVAPTFADEAPIVGPGDLLFVPPGAHRPTLFGCVHVEVVPAGGREVVTVVAPLRTRNVQRATHLAGVAAGWAHVEELMTPLLMPAWARLITLELLRHDGECGAPHSRHVDPLVTAVLDELSGSLARGTSLDRLAARTGFSPQHINRVFSRVFGVTPLRYLTQMRMERAAMLLIRNGLPVRIVARRVGYDDPYHFSRVFKQCYGRSPSEYRVRAAESAAPSTTPA
jgi:AraC-like DNA-binding protein